MDPVISQRYHGGFETNVGGAAVDTVGDVGSAAVGAVGDAGKAAVGAVGSVAKGIGSLFGGSSDTNTPPAEAETK